MSISAQLLTFVPVLFIHYAEVLYSNFPIVWYMYCLCNIIRFGMATVTKLSLSCLMFSHTTPQENAGHEHLLWYYKDSRAYQKADI